MIINDTVNLYNVAQTKSYKGGLMLIRYPSNVISKMGYGANIKGKTKALYPAMAEIQVRSFSKYVDITLMAIESDAQIICFIDNISVGVQSIRKGKIETLRFELHKRQIEYLKSKGDQSVLWRFIMPSYTRISFYNVQAESTITKMTEEQDTYVLYGSSISQGVGALNVASCYAFRLQEELHISILNKSLSGACLLEPDVINYLVGLNAPIVIVNILQILENIYHHNAIISEFAVKDKLFIKQIKQMVKKYSDKGHIYLINSIKNATSLELLTQDLLHPSNKGHEAISCAVYEFMRKNKLCQYSTKMI